MRNSIAEALTFISDEASQDINEIIALGKSFALKAIELRSINNKNVCTFNSTELNQLCATLADANLSVCCLDTPVFKCDLNDRPTVERHLEMLIRAADVAACLEAKVLRIFSFWRTPNPHLNHKEAVEWIDRACERVKGYPFILGIENGKRTMHSTGAEMAFLLNSLSHHSLGVVWDPGNCIYGGTDLDPLNKGFSLVAPYIAHVHIKDPKIYQDGGNQYVEVGQGNLDVQKQLELLAKINYTGYISLETHWRVNHVITSQEFDYPGGDKFSWDGMEATRRCLENLFQIANTLDS